MDLQLPPARPPSLTTPLVWVGGIALLGAALWLPGIFAVFRAIGAFFR